MKSRKTVKAILACILATAILLGGCTQGADPSTSSKAPESVADETSTPDTPEAPTEISWFMSNSGLKAAEGTDMANNPYINKIAELANVKFKSVVVPEYADFQTKFNLLISSADLPDLIHGGVFANDVQIAGDAGAFLELSDVIKNSAALSSTYTESMLNLMRDEKGKIYALRALPGRDTMAAGVNPWLIRELNDGVIPSTPDEWYNLFKKEKEVYPDAVTFSAIQGTNGLEIFFKAFGAMIDWTGVGWQVKDGKVINGMQAPKFKDAIIFMNKLYKEGLLDPTFVTNKNEDYRDRLDNKKMIISSNNLGSTLGSKVVPGQLPRLDDPAVTDDDAYYALPLIGGHNIAISAKSKAQDACVRVIEVLLSDEVRNLSSWGIEGVDYTVEGDKKVATKESDGNFGLFSMYAMMFGYGNQERLDRVVFRLTDSIANGDDPDPRKGRGPKDAEYLNKMLNAGIDRTLSDAAKCKPDPLGYITLSADTQSRKSEAMEASRTIMVKAILGETSIETMQKQIDEFSAKYQFISDEYTEKIPAVMEKLK